MRLDDSYIYGHCFNPVSVPVFDITSQRKEIRDVPCGTCYHCRITRVNEWTTRMRLQSATYKNTYFVTLTIDSDGPQKVLALHHPTFHNINKNKVAASHPLTLSKETLQRFIKRLRRYNELPTLSYFAVDEYGHTYGRPHYHLILWCDEEITLEMLQDAWRLDGQSIGEIDYNDLVKNGTLVSSNASYSFKYVCKYLQKQSFSFEDLPTYQYHLNLDYILNHFVTYKNTKVKNEYIRKEITDAPPGLDYVRTLSPEYVSSYRPFMLCSRSHAIGGRYFEAQASRFERGDLRLFGVLQKDMVFPSYFLRRVKHLICPYFPTTYAPSKSGEALCKYNSTSSRLPSVASLCSQLQDTGGSVWCTLQDVPEDVRALLPYCKCEYADSDGVARLAPLMDLTIYDKDNHHYLVYNGSFFDRYGYDRKQKKYVVVGSESVVSVCSKMDECLKKLLKFVEPFNVRRRVADEELEAYIKDRFSGSQLEFRKYRENLQSQLLFAVGKRQCVYNQIKNKF